MNNRNIFCDIYKLVKDYLWIAMLLLLIMISLYLRAEDEAKFKQSIADSKTIQYCKRNEPLYWLDYSWNDCIKIDEQSFKIYLPKFSDNYIFSKNHENICEWLVDSWNRNKKYNVVFYSYDDLPVDPWNIIWTHYFVDNELMLPEIPSWLRWEKIVTRDKQYWLFDVYWSVSTVTCGNVNKSYMVWEWCWFHDWPCYDNYIICDWLKYLESLTCVIEYN